MPPRPWLDAPNASSIEHYEFAEFAEMRLMLAANTENATCFSLLPSGRLTVEPADLVSDIQAASYHLLRHDEDNTYFLLVHDRGFVEIHRGSATPLALYTLDKGELERFRERFGKWVRRDIEDGKGTFYTLQVRRRELAICATGSAGRPLRRQNYATDVLTAFDHAVADLDSEDPCGRLVLLSGPPGTGKTYLVRAMLDAAERPRFVVVQSADVKEFLEASPLTTLCEFSRDEAKGRPIVLVIEDADACLLPRGSDNLSQLSALLNMSDGLIGVALDLRVVATTNARHIDIDPAVTRPGRTCRRIEVPPLEPRDAQRVLGEILGRTPRSVLQKAATLAELYAKAREEPRDAPQRLNHSET